MGACLTSPFQDTVHRLREMESLGLVRRLFLQIGANREGENVDLMIVQNGGLQMKGGGY